MPVASSKVSGSLLILKVKELQDRQDRQACSRKQGTENMSDSSQLAPPACMMEPSPGTPLQESHRALQELQRPQHRCVPMWAGSVLTCP
jgi:hypothetical protein